jgi:SnoaL-like domain
VRLPLLACLVPSVIACAAPPPAASPASPPFDHAAAERAVARELDDLHDAAARSDLARYFGHYAPGATFLGTDATEHWDLAAFHAYADPRFAQGKGWVFHAGRRTVSFSADGAVAWFEEDLRGEKLGPSRGSGVLVRDHERWLVSQYNLALTVPNERFTAVRALLDAPPAAGGAPCVK